jgi:hypothetical protein
MKKSELKQLIKEEIEKVLREEGPMDALGSVYGAFQTKKPTTTTTTKNEESFVITNDKEWYAGAEDYIKFAKHDSQSNLYPTYSSAQKALFYEIPDNVVKEKQLKIKRFS